MTRKLYHMDPYQTQFTARVASQTQVSDGRWEIELDSTAFYPTSGGQPCDQGTLNGQAVVDVFEQGDTVIHVLTAPLPEDSPVAGEIDWERRFDHMQQHAGQHVLSQAFIQVTGAETVGFHLSDNSVTIDINAAELTVDQVAEVQQLANQIVMQNRAITTHVFASAADVDLPIRKAGKAQTNVRVVEVADFDYSPCGGTHPRAAGEIGLVKLLKWEKAKGNTRVYFACGLRALADYQDKGEIVDELARFLSVGAESVLETVQGWDSQLKELRKQVADLSNALLDYEAKELVADSDSHVHVLHFEERPVEEVRYLAVHLLKVDPAAVVITGVAEPKPFVMVAAGEHSGIDAGQILRHCGAEYGWKGGGSARMAQGGAQADTLQSGLAYAKQLVLDSLGS